MDHPAIYIYIFFFFNNEYLLKTDSVGRLAST